MSSRKSGRSFRDEEGVALSPATLPAAEAPPWPLVLLAGAWRGPAAPSGVRQRVPPTSVASLALNRSSCIFQKSPTGSFLQMPGEPVTGPPTSPTLTPSPVPRSVPLTTPVALGSARDLGVVMVKAESQAPIARQPRPCVLTTAADGWQEPGSWPRPITGTGVRCAVEDRSQEPIDGAGHSPRVAVTAV